jgi:hypothetical protein
VRIILHAGLHKSGTTSVQAGWSSAYAEHPEVSYPRRGHGPPGHHDLFRPLLVAFTEGRAADLAGARARYALGGAKGPGLAEVVASAASRGTGTLLLSSESLDRAVDEDRPRLVEALGEHDLTVVLTATRPVHRWCSGWQTLVKQGLAQYPRDAAHHILDFAALRPRRLVDLVQLLPAVRRVVRLVRTAPPEPDLAAGLAAALGLPDAERASGLGARNTSLGTDTEVVLRMNRAGVALGTSRDGRELLERLRGQGFAHRDDEALAARYALPDDFGRLAADEAAWLEGPAGAEGVEVVDPYGALSDWRDAAPPDWYAAISGREAVVPSLDDALAAAEDCDTQLWRARQELSVYRRRSERSRDPSREAEPT